MADITATDDVTWDQAAYDRLTYFAFRPENYFDRFATVRATRQSMPGSSVVFDKTADLSVASSAIDESSDIDAVTLSNSPVTVTLAEYGNAVLATAKLRATSYLAVDPVIANVIGQNAGISIDTVARAAFLGGSNVLYGGAATDRDEVTPADTITGAKFRRIRAELAAASVPRIGGFYVAMLHPDQVYDLRGETDLAGWRAPKVYSNPAQIDMGTIEAFEGFMVFESPRVPVLADAGSSTTLTDVYQSVFFGAQAVAKGHSVSGGYGANPVFVATPVTDKLRRFIGMGWKHLVGYAKFRDESLWRLETASSIGANAA